MFRWYKNAKVCYVHLFDVPRDVSLASMPLDFSESRGFTRGWTLQELIAPHDVRFYSQDWHVLGDKHELCGLLSDITRIEIEVLEGLYDLEGVSVAKKMSWAASRQTTRSEDVAYCLLGIFNVFMPLLYGEEENAFVRLKAEIEGSSRSK